jgi:uncharacterized membrane protein
VHIIRDARLYGISGIDVPSRMLNDNVLLLCFLGGVLFPLQVSGLNAGTSLFEEQLSMICRMFREGMC